MLGAIERFKRKLISFGVKYGVAGKVALAVASMAVLMIPFSWQFSLFLMAMIYVHESGHVWAIRKLGGDTSGFYFLPFFGGVTLRREAAPTQKAEVFISGSGPAFTFLMSVGLIAAWHVSGNAFFGLCAAITAALGNGNLLPVKTADGRTLFDAIVPETRSNAAILVWAVVIIALAGIFYCLDVVAVLCAVWIASAVNKDRTLVYGQNPDKKLPLTPGERSIVLFGYAGMLLLNTAIAVAACHIMGGSLWDLI